MASPTSPQPGSAQEQAVADAYFRGNTEFFRRFRQDCLTQFGHDLAEGERCAQAALLPGLMHLGHSLKTVLRLIGEEPLADCARQLELSARAQDSAASLLAWAELAGGLQQLLPPQAPAPGA
ncbi:Hpt domain-containing protein [Inhella sp.]|uniref:Hpt domain-containing protein n=1 Tax=Inhella sp. TaxID=1921806 RepID=UPI0035B0E926